MTRSVPFVINCLGSKVRYRDDVSVYEVDRCFPDKFDIVIFYGVLYHLRYPVLGLAKLRQVLKTGGLLLLESAVVLDVEEPLMRWDHERIYPPDPSTWNAPSLPCLRFLLESSYFEVELCETYLRESEDLKIGRAYARATAAESSPQLHHIVPDHFLRDHFDARPR